MVEECDVFIGYVGYVVGCEVVLDNIFVILGDCVDFGCGGCGRFDELGCVVVFL